MRRRVHLVGAFRGFHNGPIEIEADTVWDAVEGVTMQVAGFKPDLSGRKTIQVVGFDTIERLKAWDDTTTDIYIMPALTFGKRGGLIQTIIGVTLIVVGFVLSFTPLAPLSPFLINAGIAMTIGGIMQMLTPQPQLSVNNEDQVRSKYLATNRNTVKIGTPIPLLYGRRRIGGHILSLNIDAVDTGL